MSVMHGLASVVGKALRPVHAGERKLVLHKLHVEDAPRIDLRSPAFVDGGPIPREYTADGGDLSPPLWWGDVPPETRELVLICEDPDAPFPKPFLHWLVFGIEAHASGLPLGEPHVPFLSEPAGAQQSRNSTRHDGYAGPAPPTGHGVHHYHFQLFALDVALAIDEHPTRDRLLEVIRGHVVAVGHLVGTYERR